MLCLISILAVLCIRMQLSPIHRDNIHFTVKTWDAGFFYLPNKLTLLIIVLLTSYPLNTEFFIQGNSFCHFLSHLTFMEWKFCEKDLFRWCCPCSIHIDNHISKRINQKKSRENYKTEYSYVDILFILLIFFQKYVEIKLNILVGNINFCFWPNSSINYELNRL